MDDLTEQNVLLVPQKQNITVQAVCTSFLQRKQRAKDKPQHLLTKDDVRLLINFGPVNDKIKPIPSHTAKTDDVFIMLGCAQGLLGQAEEFDEVLAKVLKDEQKSGICAKIVDDFGGKLKKKQLKIISESLKS